MGRWAGDGAWARRGWCDGGGGDMGEEDDGVAAAFPQLLLMLVPRPLPPTTPTAAARAVSRRREMSCARAFISSDGEVRGGRKRKKTQVFLLLCG